MVALCSYGGVEAALEFLCLSQAGLVGHLRCPYKRPQEPGRNAQPSVGRMRANFGRRRPNLAGTFASSAEVRQNLALFTEFGPDSICIGPDSPLSISANISRDIAQIRPTSSGQEEFNESGRLRPRLCRTLSNLAPKFDRLWEDCGKTRPMSKFARIRPELKEPNSAEIEASKVGRRRNLAGRHERTSCAISQTYIYVHVCVCVCVAMTGD